MKPQFLEIELERIQHSTTNPPERIAPDTLQELAASIRTQGVLEPLLVRPDYCVGARSPAEIDARRREFESVEIVAGARRCEAARLAAVAAVPCFVREMDDGQAIEAQVVENLQRRDLTPKQEAQNFSKMLAIVETDGTKRYTVTKLAERLGVARSVIYWRLMLLDIPKQADEALCEGLVPARVAAEIGRIPSPELREKAAKEIITPQLKKEPLTVIEAHEWIRTHYMQGLRGAPFKLADADLVPEAGACSACPHMTDNCAHLFSPEDSELLKNKICCNPACYRAKVDAVYERLAGEAAAEGKTLLSEKESREIYPTHCSSGEMHWDSRYVEISGKPDESLLKPEVEKVGTWRKLVEEAEEKTGAKVPRVIARDQAGAPRELVERGLAIAAVEKSGEPIFRTNERAQPKAEDGFAKERKKEQEESKKRLAITLEAVAVVHRELLTVWHLDPVWDALFDVALAHAGDDGLRMIGKWQGVKFGDDADKAAVIGKHAATLKPAEKQALVPLLLVSHALKWNGVAAAGFIALAEGVAVDLDALKRVVTQRLKDEKAAQKAAKKKGKAEATPAPADPVIEKLRQEVVDAFTAAGIATDDIRNRTVRFACKGKTFAELTAPEEFQRVLEMLRRKTEGSAA